MDIAETADLSTPLHFGRDDKLFDELHGQDTSEATPQTGKHASRARLKDFFVVWMYPPCAAGEIADVILSAAHLGAKNPCILFSNDIALFFLRALPQMPIQPHAVVQNFVA
jgi:hypothetical protein